MNAAWNPPRGAVTLTRVDPEAAYPHYRVDCDACGWTYPGAGYSAIRTDCDDRKRYHRCPPGTAAALPTCAVCASTGRRCKPAGELHDDHRLPSPVDAGITWHADRAVVYLEEVRS